MSTTEVKIIEQLLETIKEKDATISELKREVERLKGLGRTVFQPFCPSITTPQSPWLPPYTIITTAGNLYNHEGIGYTAVFDFGTGGDTGLSYKVEIK